MDFSKLKIFDWLMLGQGTLITIALCLAAIVGGGLIAMLAMTPTVWPKRWILRAAVIGYVEFFRSTPLLLQLIAIYFALPLVGLPIPAVVAAGIALILYSGAYLTEILRAGLEAVPRGQWEASLSLGMSRAQVLRNVIAQQALRIVLPSIVSFIVMLVKGSAVVSVIGFSELTRSGRLVVEWTREPFAVWIVVGLIYFLLCYPLSILGRRLEHRLGHGTSTAA